MRISYNQEFPKETNYKAKKVSPHLNTAICVSSEKIAPWSWAHAIRSFAFVHAKRTDGTAVNRLDHTHSVYQTEQNVSSKHSWKVNKCDESI